MLRIRTFVLLITVYIIAFVSVRLEINLFYPYDLLRNYLFLPVIASVKNNDLEHSEESKEAIILNLKDEIEELKKLTEIKTVLSDFERINATVIERNRNYWFNTITIDKGKNDGIKENMAVVDANGLIGKVNKVSKNMSEIKLITTSDVNNKTSVVIINGDKKIYGIIERYENGYLEVTLTSKNVDIKDNLQVMTTGMGGIYPSGILIGHTSSFKSSKYDVGLIVLVKPVSDFQNLRYVNILVRE